MRVHVLLAAFLLCSAGLAASCQRAEVRASCPESGSASYFFPPGLLESERDDLDAMTREWYSKHLNAMAEPSLSCGRADADEVYRFVWLRTFHQPVSVRISRRNNEAALAAVEMSGAGGYEPGAVVQRIGKRLSADDWAAFEAALSRSDYWLLPTRPSPRQIGFDGAQWIVEAQRGETYHVVDRWTPDDGAYRDLGLIFLRLAGLRAEGEDVY